MCRRLPVKLLFAIAAVAPPCATAQRSLGLEVALSRFSAASLDTTSGGSRNSFHPHQPTLFGVRLDWQLGRAGLGLGVLYGEAGLVDENGEVAVVQKGVFALLELAPEVSLRIARSGTGTDVRIHAGPVFDVWTEQGGGGRIRDGAQGAVSADWPVAGRLAGTVRATVARTSSVFDAGELPVDFERRAMWRRSLSLGLRYRL
jgi:hypothetical protein